MTDLPDPETRAGLLPPHRGGGARGVFGNAAVLLGGKTANSVFNLAYLAITARALGADIFGVLVLIHTFAQAVGDIAQFQSWQAVLQYGSRPASQGDRQGLQRVIRFSLVLDLLSGVAGTLIAVVVAGTAGRLLGWPPGSAPAAMLYVTSVFFMVSATPFGVLRLFDRFDLLAVQSSVNSIVRLAAVALAWAMGAGLGGFLAAWYIGTVIAFISLFGWAWLEMRRRGLTRDFPVLDGHLTRGFPGIWRFAWTTNLNTTLELIFTRAGTLFVGALLTPAAAALFRIAWQVANAISKPAKTVVNALYPELARMWVDNDHAGIRLLAAKVALVCGGAGTVLLLLSAVAGGPLLGLVLGPSFAEAGRVMTWLVAAAVIGAWVLPLEPLLISTGRAGAVVKVRLVVSVLFLLLISPLIGAFGLDGAGAASVIYSLAMALGLLIYVAPWRRRQTR